MGKNNKKDSKDKSNSKKVYQTQFPVDTIVLAKNKRNQWRDAKIIQVKPNRRYIHDKRQQNLRFYVNYQGCDRRWDQYVTFDKIRPWEPRNKDQKTNGQNYIQHDVHQGLDQRNLAQHEKSTKFKTIQYIIIGKNKCQTWYFSPFPDYFQNLDTLYTCEFCLSFFRSENQLVRHGHRCPFPHPLGNQIYRDDGVAVFQIDGARNITYCENLCYISKLFLDHKNLGFDVEPFLFYVLTEVDEWGCHFAGYFSKEKESQHHNNLSCILVMPFMQRKGFGKFLITLSYELSKREHKIGTPERPLSDLGFASYFSWWTAEIVDLLKDHQGQQLSINDISQKTYIMQQDVQDVLEKLNILRYSQGNHYIYANTEYLDRLKRMSGKPGRPVDTSRLHWTPLRIPVGKSQ